MVNQKSRIAKFVHWIAPNAIWDVIKWLGGSSMMASIAHLLWAEFHRNKADWYSITAYFGVGVALILIAIVLQGRSADKVHPSPLSVQEYHPDPSLSLFESLGLDPIQIEILTILKDIRKFVEDAGDPPKINLTNPGPMPKGANREIWMEVQQIDTDKWLKDQMRWSVRFKSGYQQQFSERIQRLARSIGVSTGKPANSLEPYMKSITPNDGIADLRGILWGLLRNLDKDAKEPTDEQSPPPMPVGNNLTIRILEGYFGVTPNDVTRYVILLSVRVDGVATKLKNCKLTLERGGKPWKPTYRQPIIAAQPIEFVPGIKGIVDVEKENKLRLIPGSALDPLVPSKGFLHFTAENCDARFPDLLRGATFILEAISEESYETTCTALAAEWLHPAVIIGY